MARSLVEDIYYHQCDRDVSETMKALGELAKDPTKQLPTSIHVRAAACLQTVLIPIVIEKWHAMLAVLISARRSSPVRCVSVVQALCKLSSVRFWPIRQPRLLTEISMQQGVHNAGRCLGGGGGILRSWSLT